MISDDDLLAAVHTCGRAGDVGSLHDCLRERVGLDLDSAHLTERLERLHRAGFMRVFQPHEHDVPRYRLTQIGIERLDELGTEASAVPSD
jgi:hypothetical protein